jgi:nucleoside-diphosphate-sugar epimerase
MEIQGSVVVVTGASSDIGLAIVRSFAHAGAKVVLAARSSEMLNAVAQELQEHGHEALALATDVTDQTQVNQLIEATCEHFGQIDTLCCEPLPRTPSCALRVWRPSQRPWRRPAGQQHLGVHTSCFPQKPLPEADTARVN